MISNTNTAAAQLNNLSLEPFDSETAGTSLDVFWEALCAYSEFFARTYRQYPDFFQTLHRADLQSALSPDRIAEITAPLTAIEAGDEAGFMQRIRAYRNTLQALIVARDIGGIADVSTTLSEISHLAERLIQHTYDFAYRTLSSRHGEPVYDDDNEFGIAAGEPMHMAILGMGKLGGYELNFSSDVDLIGIYPHAGDTDGRKPIAHEAFFRKPIAHEAFFRKLMQRLSKYLCEVQANGFVYRVDLRLRPFGDSGPLACSANAFEHYYQVNGREWERYALIKARCVAGDAHFGRAVLESVRPFVYRRYLDYSAFASLREMKRLISTQVEKKGLQENIKLGRGGIREIEFIAQAYQLIYGGRDKALQTQSLYQVLNHLGEQPVFGSQKAERLIEAYNFLRKLENQLQNWDDQQTQALPSDPTLQQRLADIMGYADYPALSVALRSHRAVVEEVFDALFAAQDSESDTKDEEATGDGMDPQGFIPQLISSDGFSALWDEAIGVREQVQEWLISIGVHQPDGWIDALLDLLKSRRFRSVSSDGQHLFVSLLPRLVAELQDRFANEQAGLIFGKILGLVQKICNRTNYLSLLKESKLVRNQLMDIASRSDWLMGYIAEHPMVLDELIGHEEHYAPRTREEMRADLDQFMENAAQDREHQLDLARQFKQAQLFQIAVADISDNLTLMQVSDQLTLLAEVLLHKELQLATDEVAERHGLPDTEAEQPPEIGVLGFGKLGGYELGYGSDLDLVFVYYSQTPQDLTVGRKPIPQSQFFAKVAQKLVTRLSTPMLGGELYEVDTRLRPSGNAGVLVTSLSVFDQYQQESAWVWEHQALCRARMVVGSAFMRSQFESIRARVLAAPRDKAALAREVIDMRNKMRRHLAPKPGQPFHLKHSPGGIVDIEFLVQYWLLANAQSHPDITTYTDNIRQIEVLVEAGIISQDDGEALRVAYLALREQIHALKLLGKGNSADETEWSRLAQIVNDTAKIWERTFPDTLTTEAS